MDHRLAPKLLTLLTSIEAASEGKLTEMMANVVDFKNEAGEEEEEELDCFTWNLYNSVFFSFTAVTTIGIF